MSSPDTMVFDQTPARRPSVEDVGGAQKENDAAKPDPVRHVTAEDVNHWARLLQRLCGIVPVAIVHVHADDESATVLRVVALSTGANAPEPGVIASAFAAERDDEGVYTVTWTADVLPAPVLPPRVRTVYDGSSDEETRAAQCAPVAGGARVQVFRGTDGAFVDCDFVLEIY
jgi:hypothetical protein